MDEKKNLRFLNGNSEHYSLPEIRVHPLVVNFVPLHLDSPSAFDPEFYIMNLGIQVNLLLSIPSLRISEIWE